MSGKGEKNRFTSMSKGDTKKKPRERSVEKPEKVVQKSPKEHPKSRRDPEPVLKPKVSEKKKEPGPDPEKSDSSGEPDVQHEPPNDEPVKAEYEMEVMAVCISEEQRLLVERDLVAYISNDLKVSPHDINIAGYASELSISCHNELPEVDRKSVDPKSTVPRPAPTFFATSIRKKLFEIAIRHKICFEVDYNSDAEPIGTCFVGIGEDDRDTDYLLEELFGVLPRLAKRTTRLSKRFNVPEDSLKKALAVLWSLHQ